MRRITEVNRELAKRGFPERLRRGKGYYYFTGGNAPDWPQSGVYVFRAEAVSLVDWLKEYERLAGIDKKTAPGTIS